MSSKLLGWEDRLAVFVVFNAVSVTLTFPTLLPELDCKVGKTHCLELYQTQKVEVHVMLMFLRSQGK